MPLVDPSPPAQSPVSDRWQIVQMTFDLPPNNPERINVTAMIQHGHETGGDFVHDGQQPQMETVSGTALTTKMSEISADGRNVYDVVKYAIWELLVAEKGYTGDIS